MIDSSCCGPSVECLRVTRWRRSRRETQTLSSFRGQRERLLSEGDPWRPLGSMAWILVPLMHGVTHLLNRAGWSTSECSGLGISKSSTELQVKTPLLLHPGSTWFPPWIFTVLIQMMGDIKFIMVFILIVDRVVIFLHFRFDKRFFTT